MWAYDFMLNALLAGVMAATTCALVSVFVVLRRTGFAAHALGHMSLTGAAGAALLGMPMMLGQLLFNVLAAMVMGFMGDKVRKNDLAVGVVLTFVLGLGAYFLFLFQNNYAGSVMSILFGNIFAVSREQLWQMLGLSLVVITILIIISRPLIFSSIDPVVAAAKNLSLRLLSVVFFAILAITVTMACQVVGVLLVFVLLIIPGAVGMQWGESVKGVIAISVIVANLAVVAALYLSYQFNLPASFCITMILCLVYFLGAIYHWVVKKI